MNDVAERACSWLAYHLDAFRAAPCDERSAMLRVKRLAELATLGGALTHRPGAFDFARLAWREIGEGRDIAALLPRYPAIAAAYLPFLDADLRSASLECAMTERAWISGHERWPLFVRFAVGVTLESFGVAVPWKQSVVLAAQDLFTPPDDSATPLKAVKLAHVVMWATNMGKRSSGLDAHRTARFHAIAPSWIRALTLCGALDPLAELCAAIAYSGGSVDARALALLARWQRPDGAVPPVAGVGGLGFDELYHPTIAAALATSARPQPAIGDVLRACAHALD